MRKLTQVAVAVALALPMLAHAESNEELKSQIEELKAQLNELKSIVKQQTETRSAAADAVDPAEFNKVRVKVEAMEDNQESSGFKGLKISGFIDPTAIYNQRAHHGGFLFFNNNYSSDPTGTVNDLTADTFSYDNSYFGGATLRFDKEFEGGVRAMLTLRPRRNVAATYDIGTIVEEAGIWVPFHGLAWKAWAGQAISWNGYEYVQANLKKNITSNLLLDFAGPGFVTGAGVEYQQGKWWVKTAVGNINTTHDKPGDSNTGLHWRVDYSKGEFQGWGASGMHGELFGKGYNYLEADGYFTRGAVNIQGQIEASNWDESGFNGGDTGHIGASMLASYKFTPVTEGIVRMDWFDNHRNGGGTPATSMGTASCPAGSDDGSGGEWCGDYRNGFGPGVKRDATGAWVLGNPNRGAERSAITLGLNYQYHTNALVKLELRHDMSDLNSFYDISDGSYKKSNTIFGVQTVVSF